MCVILDILPGTTVPKEKLFNAAANNWHSWGLVIVKDEKLEAIQRVPKNADLPESKWRSPDIGGCWQDVEEIYKLLADNINARRYLHFRHATKGHIDLDNCHPFIVFQDEDRTVCMMHNGQFNGNYGYNLDRDGDAMISGVKWACGAPSDTKDFIEKHIIVPLDQFADGDYTDPIFKEHYLDNLMKEKNGQSKVIFIANDLPSVKYGYGWIDFVDTETKELKYQTSNNEYFDRVKRGPLFLQQEDERLRKIREENAQKAKEEPEKDNVVIVPYQQHMFQGDPEIIQGLKLICELCGGDHFPNRISDLSSASVPEFESVIHLMMKEDKAIVLAAFIDFLITGYIEVEDAMNGVIKELNLVKEKHTNASRLVAEKTKEIEKLLSTVSKLAKGGSNEPRQAVA